MVGAVVSTVKRMFALSNSSPVTVERQIAWYLKESSVVTDLVAV